MTIEDFAAGGAGVARVDGAALFVPRTAIGDRVEVEVKGGANPMRGRVLRVIEPSRDRVEPPCSVWSECGGCDWMQVREAAQREGHARIVKAAIARATGVELPAIAVHAAPSALAYRTRARLFVRGDKRGVAIGYRAEASNEVVAIDRCLVLAPALDDLARTLAPIFEGARGEGDVKLALGASSKPVVDVELRGEVSAVTWNALDARVREGAWAGARLLLEGAATAASFGDPRPVMIAADGAPLVITAGGFAQPSDDGAAMLARRVAELASKDARGPRHVLELFAGSGTLSVLLAKGAASFTAVEIDRASVECARANLASRGLEHKLVVADADAANMSPKTEVVVLDPPRAGAPGASKAIAVSNAKTIVYVSCDPPTLARDLATILAPGRFAITDVEAFELFPQTSHVETVVRLARKR